MSDGIVPEVRKIAVLRANALGDLIVALPALQALRAAYPAAEITLLGLPWHAEFLPGHASPVDRVVVVPYARGIREAPDGAADPKALKRFFRTMAAERFDLALQLHGGGTNSNPFARRLGARVTAGLKAPDAPPLDRWVPYVYYQPEVFRYLEVVALVGARPVAVEPSLAVTGADLAASRLAVQEAATPLVVLHPGAGDPRRRWPPEKFAAVGDALAKTGARVVVTGTAGEREICAAVTGGMQAEAIDLCDRLTLRALTGLLARSALVVSNDSGPLHLARAVGAATVGIYWCGNLINAGPATRARHRPVLSWRLACPVCGLDCTRGRCEHAASFVADVPVEEVVAQALDLLGVEGNRPT